MSATVATILIFVILIALILIIPVIRVRSAMKAVIKIFRAHDATDIQHARTSAELQLNPKKFVERLFTLRDYKPDALKVLMESGVIKSTEEGKLFLSETALNNSKLKSFLEKQ
ncbi:MAG: hypothetical protein SVV67_00180 [Bacillota bacterium]|nr:hypothetical protein [Bacillota bacterium]